MAPGAWHAVYTPVRTVATGGHIFMYETMHLTEVSRSFDRQHGLCVTNTSHVSAYDTLCCMMIDVIRGDMIGEFHLVVSVYFEELTDYAELRLKPLDALCRMVLNHIGYIAQTGMSELTKSVKEDAKSITAKLARTIAEYLVRHFNLDLDDDNYLFKSGESWMDPGDTVDMAGVFDDWAGTPLRPAGLTDQLPTIKDITSGTWKPPSERNEAPVSVPTDHKRRRSTRNIDRSKKQRKG